MSRSETMWEKADVSYQNYLAYIDRKTDRFALTLIDLLYVSNFKSGNAAIHETETTIQDKLIVYSAAMKSLEATFGGKALGDLTDEELGNLNDRAQEFVALSMQEPTAIAGFDGVYTAALLHFYFPRLAPIPDKRVIGGLGLLAKYDRNRKDRQVTNIWMHYSTLFERFHAYLKLNPGKTIRDFDRECFTKEPVRLEISFFTMAGKSIMEGVPVEELTLPQIQTLLGPSALPGTGPHRLSREQCNYLDQFLVFGTNPELHTEVIIHASRPEILPV